MLKDIGKFKTGCERRNSKVSLTSKKKSCFDTRKKENCFRVRSMKRMFQNGNDGDNKGPCCVYS